MASEVNKPSFEYVWASGGASVAPSNVKVQTGWTAEVPPFQWENWSQNRQDTAILHLFQKGISVWDSVSNYYFTSGGVRSYVQGSNGTIYVALQNSIGQNPVTDTANTYWREAFPVGGRLIRTSVYTLIGGVQMVSIDGAAFTTTGAANFNRQSSTTKILIEGVGGGGGSGIVQATTSTQTAAVGGGSSGSWFKAQVTAATIGTSQVVTIGAAGLGGTAGGPGLSGGTTSVGTLLTAPGGGGSPAGIAVATTSSGIAAGGISGSTTTGGNLVNTAGQQGNYGFTILSQTLGGTGGSNPLGVGGQSGGISFTPTSGTGYGAGAAGIANGTSQPAKVGIAGLAGAVFFYEYA